ncbi:MAG TPA: class I SAM-dependent methyltransferase [Symbiobacteriaceae bacterium]|jgi:SAM-dependent methyltransferase
MLRNPVAPELLELLDAGSPGDADFYSEYARRSGGPVLVLLSGTGRIAIPIARQGIPVIGLDTDAGMVDQAKRKAQQFGAARAMFVRGDPTHFVSDSKHPLVCIPSGALQRLLTLEEQRSCLTAARHALGVGGKLVLDFPLGEPATPGVELPVVKWQGVAGERAGVLRRHRKYEPALQLVEDLISCDWLDREGQVEKTQYAMLTTRYSTPGEIELLLTSCGFATTVFGGFERQDLLPGAGRLVVEAQRTM